MQALTGAVAHLPLALLMAFRSKTAFLKIFCERRITDLTNKFIASRVTSTLGEEHNNPKYP